MNLWPEMSVRTVGIGHDSNKANNNSKSPFIVGQNRLLMIHSTFPIHCSQNHRIRMVVILRQIFDHAQQWKKNAGFAIVVVNGDESAIGNIMRNAGVAVGHLFAP
jgi:hypothetical protein